ncbi:MAG: inner membrane protein YpjD [Gemmatimonadota bacterium]
MTAVLHLAAFAAYVTAWGLQLRGFKGAGPVRSAPAVAALSVGAVSHLGGLAAFAGAHETMPLVGLGPASSSLAFVIALVVLAASVRSETRPAGLFLLPVVLVLLAEALYVGVRPTPRQTAFRGPWFVLHVGSTFSGYAGLLLASAASAMYLFQFRALKRKKFGSVFRFFPPLEALDRLSRSGLYFGFPALTLGLLLGWSWTLTYGGSGLALGSPEVLFGIVTWLAYLVALFMRTAPGGRGERAAAVSTGAFVITLAVFLALRFTVSASGFFI